MPQNHGLKRAPKVFNPADVISRPKPKGRLFSFILKVIVLGVFLVAIVYLFFYSDLFSIKEIMVDESLPQSMADELKDLKGKNIFLIKTSGVKASLLKSFPELSNIEIARGLPSTLKVVYTERTSSLLWETQERFFLVDTNGLIYKEIQGDSDLPKVIDNNNLPIKIGQQVVSTGFINFVTDFRTKSNSLVEVDHFEVNETTFQVDCLSKDHLKIKLDSTRSTDSQLEDLRKFLDSHKNDVEEYIDLRVEGKVYYK